MKGIEVPNTSVEAEPAVTVVRDSDTDLVGWKVTHSGASFLVASAIAWPHGVTLHLYGAFDPHADPVRVTIADETEAHAVAALHASLMAKAASR